MSQITQREKKISQWNNLDFDFQITIKNDTKTLFKHSKWLGKTTEKKTRVLLMNWKWFKKQL